MKKLVSFCIVLACVGVGCNSGQPAARSDKVGPISLIPSAEAAAPSRVEVLHTEEIGMNTAVIFIRDTKTGRKYMVGTNGYRGGVDIVEIDE